MSGATAEGVGSVEFATHGWMSMGWGSSTIVVVVVVVVAVQ